jgi:hypothetical protein
VKKSIQDKIDAIKKQAQASSATYPVREMKNPMAAQDSLAKVIRNQKEADIFLAELEAVIKQAQKK